MAGGHGGSARKMTFAHHTQRFSPGRVLYEILPIHSLSIPPATSEKECGSE